MYQVSVEGHFDAAHFLRDYGGKCEKLHGHRFKVVVTVKSSKLNPSGLAYDFVELKHHLDTVLNKYDHASLNDITPFNKINTSSENIAVAVYNQLKGRFHGRVALVNVQVWESPQSWVTYSHEGD